ncbi:MAG: high-affinity branched-chain amino acid ABC transporter permease LivM [Geminicoccaceae bacterium]
MILVMAGRLGLILAERGLPTYAVAGGLAFAIGGWMLPMPTDFLRVLTVAGGAIVALRGGYNLYQRSSGLSQAQRDARGEAFGETFRASIKFIAAGVVILAIFLPFLPFSSRYVVDVATLSVTYVMLGWGLNIIVGYAGLLDLGFVAFYAVGAYSYALFAQNFGLSFWVCLPLAGLLAASFGVMLGFPILRLRGDYFAIVTLGFGEIIRIILINWYNVTNGPDGISRIPRPGFGPFPFTRSPDEGQVAFHQLFGLEYSSMHRIIFLYYLILVLAALVAVFTMRIRKLPLGRAWEALREDDIACASLGINRTMIKLAAFGISATWGGFAGAFFATRQGFISPESFTFIESAIILAIVVMGGMGSLIGVAFAAIILIGLPEIFRDLEEYRMLAFGAGLVLIMIWRPRGLLAFREPSVRLFRKGEEPRPKEPELVEAEAKA